MLKSIKGKMISIFTLLILLLVIGSSWISYNQSRNILRETLNKEAKNNAVQYSKLVNEWLKGIQLQMLSLVDSDAIKSMNWSTQSSTLQRITENQDHISTFFLADTYGRTRFTSGKQETVDLAGEEYIRKIIDGQDIYISSIIKNNYGEDENVIVFTAPIYIPGTDMLNEILGAYIKLDYLQEIVNEMNISGSGSGWIADRRGKVIAHSAQEYIANTTFIDKIGTELRALIFKEDGDSTEQPIAGNGYFLLAGQEKQVAYSIVEMPDWFLAISAETEQVLAPLDSIKNSSILSVLIAIIVGAIITYYITGFITKPIINLNTLAQKVAAGDLSKNIEITDSKDEIGALNKSVNKMVNNLSTMVRQINNTNQQVSTSSHDLSSSGLQVGNLTEQVGMMVDNVAAGAEEQAALVEEISSNITELNDQIATVDKSSVKMIEIANLTLAGVKEGSESVKISIAEINGVKKNTVDVMAVIESLNNTSKEINEIINIINNIARQTNLLALNAAIEAARAGEAGRGFSVVADEIRDLSEETSSSTEDISRLINKIQTAVNTTIDKMNRNVTRVSKSVETINDTGNVIDHLNTETTSLIDFIKQVAKNVETMVESSRSVDTAIAEIASVSQEFASSSEEVTAIHQEQLKAINQIAENAGNMADLAEDLSVTVNKFKVK